MQARLGVAALASVVSSLLCGAAVPENKAQTIPLTVPAGVPLRLYLTKRIPKKAGAPVEAKLLDPIWAFDRQVLPAGVVVSGIIRRIEPVAKAQRLQAVFGGDLTPLHTAWIDFDSVQMPDGRKLALQTVESVGFGSVVPNGAMQTIAAQPANHGVLGTGEQKVKEAVHAELARVKGITGIAKAPDKKARLYDFAMSKVPHHPQYLRKGTRIDAELREPLSFGTETLPPGTLAMLGSEPAADMVAHARLITPVDSASSSQGEPVEAVLAAPLYSSDHHLVMPEGTRLLGSVIVAKPARSFHRGGKLRFTFSRFEMPTDLIPTADAKSSMTQSPAAKVPVLELRTRATLQAAESDGKTPAKIDDEGGVQAKESNKRFIAPVISALIARAAADNDPERSASGAIVGQSSNVGGRTLGGASGFGLLGAAAAQSSKYVGTAFGFYGMAWSIYSNVISRGFEVAFPKNAMVDVKFNTREPAPPPKPHGG